MDHICCKASGASVGKLTYNSSVLTVLTCVMLLKPPPPRPDAPLMTTAERLFAPLLNPGTLSMHTQRGNRRGVFDAACGSHESVCLGTSERRR